VKRGRGALSPVVGFEKVRQWLQRKTRQQPRAEGAAEHERQREEELQRHVRRQAYEAIHAAAAVATQGAKSPASAPRATTPRTGPGRAGGGARVPDDDWEWAEVAKAVREADEAVAAAKANIASGPARPAPRATGRSGDVGSRRAAAAEATVQEQLGARRRERAERNAQAGGVPTPCEGTEAHPSAASAAESRPAAAPAPAPASAPQTHGAEDEGARLGREEEARRRSAEAERSRSDPEQQANAETAARWAARAASASCTDDERERLLERARALHPTNRGYASALRWARRRRALSASAQWVSAHAIVLAFVLTLALVVAAVALASRYAYARIQGLAQSRRFSALFFQAFGKSGPSLEAEIAALLFVSSTLHAALLLLLLSRERRRALAGAAASSLLWPPRVLAGAAARWALAPCLLAAGLLYHAAYTAWCHTYVASSRLWMSFVAAGLLLYNAVVDFGRRAFVASSRLWASFVAAGLLCHAVFAFGRRACVASARLWTSFVAEAIWLLAAMRTGGEAPAREANSPRSQGSEREEWRRQERAEEAVHRTWNKNSSSAYPSSSAYTAESELRRRRQQRPSQPARAAPPPPPPQPPSPRRAPAAAPQGRVESLKTRASRLPHGEMRTVLLATSHYTVRAAATPLAA